jgi:hypothetical protein
MWTQVAISYFKTRISKEAQRMVTGGIKSRSFLTLSTSDVKLSQLRRSELQQLLSPPPPSQHVNITKILRIRPSRRLLPFQSCIDDQQFMTLLLAARGPHVVRTSFCGCRLRILINKKGRNCRETKTSKMGQN